MADVPEDPPLNVTSPWPVTRGNDQETPYNPYLHNIFVQLQFDPDRSQREFSAARETAGSKINSGVEWVVNRRRIGPVDKSRADQIAASAEKFISERLLAHTHHELDPKEFQEALQQLEAIPLERPESLLPLPVRDLTEIARRLPELPELILGEPQHFPQARLLELFHPSSEEEQIFDL